MNRLTTLAVALSLGLTATLAASRPPTREAHVGSNLVAKFDGLTGVRLQSARGGAATIQSPGSVKCDPLMIEADLASVISEPGGPAWLSGALRSGAMVSAGTISALNFDNAVQYVLSFERAGISSIRIGDLDGASKEAAELHVTLTPSRSQWKKDAGKEAIQQGAKTKRILAANFRVKLDNLPTQRIVKIADIGARRDDKTGAWTCTPVQLDLSMSDFEPWLAWHTEAATGKTSKRTMTIELLDASLKEAMVTLEAQGVTIVRAEPEFATGDAVNRGHIELAVESWSAK